MAAPPPTIGEANKWRNEADRWRKMYVALHQQYAAHLGLGDATPRSPQPQHPQHPPQPQPYHNQNPYSTSHPIMTLPTPPPHMHSAVTTVPAGVGVVPAVSAGAVPAAAPGAPALLPGTPFAAQTAPAQQDDGFLNDSSVPGPPPQPQQLSSRPQTSSLSPDVQRFLQNQGLGYDESSGNYSWPAGPSGEQMTGPQLPRTYVHAWNEFLRASR